MTRIYYDPVTGEILGSATHPFQIDQGNYIDIAQPIKINLYRVDPATLELHSVEPSPQPTRQR